jgi:hypothetical protein
LWKELFSLAGVKLQMSFGYHPQSDGQTERLNQTIETFLRCFVSACPAKWTQWLSLAEFWYNSSHHSAINTSPFEALYGYKPRHFGMDAMMPIQSVDLSTWLRLQERSLMDTLVKQHLHRAKTRMKKQADKSRSERSFQFFGPFRILEKIGPVAYKLQLPDYSSIHPVFHVSQLKKAVTAEEEVLFSFPDDLALPRVPKSVLQKRVVYHGGLPKQQILVQWSGWPDSLSTWENFEHLRQRFPDAPAWGQAVLQEGENVTAPPAVVPGRPTRKQKPSKKWTGPEWVNVLASTNAGPAHVTK